MELVEYLANLYDYSYWANQRVLAAAESLTGAELTQAQGHSWGTIQGTLLHMMNAEWIWLSRWHGESPKGFFDPAEFPTLAPIKHRWAELESEMRRFVAQQTNATLTEEIVYTNTKGKTYRLPLWQMMVHVANHGTHHRGELAAMFATLNAPHPEDDWLQYWLEISGQASGG
jgi:uncharacterized damage-inducible protein DinB